MVDVLPHRLPSQAGRTLAAAFDPGRNNFDAVRLAAALVVVLSHTYSLTAATWEPVSTYLQYGYGGTLAVDVFFVISGFLIARSVETQDLPAYLAARVLRIIPGLALVTVFETFIIAPIFFEGARSYYFHHYALGHLSNVLVFGEDPFVPNVFSKLPYPYLNGSLWTLPVESLFYLLLPILLLCAAGGRRWLVLLAFAASLAAGPIAHAYGLDDNHPGSFVFRTVSTDALAQYTCYFLAGVVAWTYRGRITLRPGGAALCVLILFAARDSFAAPIILKLCLPYLVLSIGVATGAGTRLKRSVGDLSYGVYLFGYPVINTVISLGPKGLGPEGVFLVTTPICLACAWLSWHFVERPALRLKRRHLGRTPYADNTALASQEPRAAQ